MGITSIESRSMSPGPETPEDRAVRRARGAILPVLLLGLAAAGWGAGAARSFQRNVMPGAALVAGFVEELRKTVLPPGTVLYLRLETPVSTKSSHLGGPVATRVVRELPGQHAVAIPLGALVRGHIQKLIPSSNPADRSRVLVRFTRLEISARPPIGIAGHISEVENARESILAGGVIQGVLTNELPASHLERALEKLGKSDAEAAARLQELEKRTLGSTDTSIDYPAGTDVQFVLDEAVTLEDLFAPAASNQLPEGESDSLKHLLAQAPRRVSGKSGEPGDPLNLVVIANADQIRRAFQEAGWTEAEKAAGKSVWETIRAVAAGQGYSAAPVSDLYLYGRAEDLAFEKMLNTFAKRHHLRLWRAPEKTAEGREVWLGAATHDNGLDVRPGVISHAIEADLAKERAKIGADLLVTGRVNAEVLLTPTDPLTEGLTATGAPWRTDGRLLAIELKLK